jgi:lysophospholipase L1-like esterase
MKIIIPCRYNTTMPKEIIFIGDSLIEFYDWAARFPDYRVHNMGRAGETVEGLLSRMQRESGSWPAPDCVFIMSGANNLAMQETGFIAEYREIIRMFQGKAPGARVFIHSVLPTLLPWITPEMVKYLNGYLRKLAEETGVTYLDVHSLFLEAGVRECLLEDGVHVSAKGYEIWSKAVEEALG